MNEREVLSPKEAAEYLDLHVVTVYRLLRAGQLPGQKIGGQWRFLRRNLDKLMDKPEDKRRAKNE